MRLAMNRFYLMPKPKPEFKMAQPLPPFTEISNARLSSIYAPIALAPVLKPNHLAMLPAGGKRESFAAFRNVTS
jgi:hypothetical protein